MINILKNLQFEAVDHSRKVIENYFQRDIENIIANERYRFIEKIKASSVKTIETGLSMTDKLD